MLYSVVVELCCFVPVLDACEVVDYCVPVIDGCVALPQPADSGQFVFVSVSTKENNDVTFRDHQVQSGNQEPAGGVKHCLRQRRVCESTCISVCVGDVCVSVCLTGRGAP